MKLGHFGIAHSAGVSAATWVAAAAGLILLLAGTSCVKLSPASPEELRSEEQSVGLAYNVALEQPYSLERPDAESEAQSPSEAQPRTKAATAYSTSDSFKSFAWYLPEGKIWSADKDDAVAYFKDVTVEFQTDKWRGADKQYFWPKLGSLSFWSYSPAAISATGKASVTTEGVSLTGWTLNETTNQDIDFMIADFKSDLKTNTLTYGYLGVPTLFRHKLAKVTVQASTAADTSATNRVKIYKVSLKRVYTVGSYTPEKAATATSEAAAETWSNRSSLKEIVIFENSKGLALGLTAQNITLDGNSLLVIPQVLNGDSSRGTSGVSLYIEYSINGQKGTADKLLSDIKSQLWGIGQHTTYSIVVGEENEPIEFNAGVGDWGEGTSSDIIIGLTK